VNTSPRPLLVLFWLSALVWLGGIFTAGWSDGGTLPVAIGLAGMLVFLATAAARIAVEDQADAPVGRGG
jgi:hypothetical protein